MRTLLLCIALFMPLAPVAPLTAQSPANAPGQEAVPAREKTVRANRVLDYAYERDRILAAFERTPSAEGCRANREEIAKFLDGGARTIAGAADAPTWEQIQTQGLSLISKGCEDPMVLALTATAHNSLKDPRASEALEHAWRTFRESEYPPIRRALLGVALAAHRAEMDPESPELDTLWDVVCGLYIQAFSEKNLGSEHLAYIFAKANSRIRSELPLARATQLVNRIIDAAAVDPWLRHMAEGMLELRLGWEARGGGYAHTVTPEGWRSFERNLRSAGRHFSAAHDLRPDLPQAAAEMIGIAMAGHSRQGENERFWFDRAVWAQIDYWPAYDKYIWSLRPRWGGSYEEMIEFGLECAATGRYDTEVPGYLLQVLLDIRGEIKNYEVVFRHPGVFKALREVALGMIATQPETKRWRTSQLAAIAWRAGEYADARTFWEQAIAIEGGFDFDAAWTIRARASDISYDAYAYTSPAADLYRQADDAMERGLWDRASELCQEALERNAQAEARVRSAAESRAAAMRMRAQFETGDWTPLTFGRGMNGWQTINTGWSSVSEDALRASTGGRTVMVSRAPFGNRIEMRGYFSFDPDADEPPASIGIIFGYDAEGGTNQARWRNISFDRGESEVKIELGNVTRHTRTFPATFKPRNHFHITVVEGNISVRLNEELVYEGPWPEYSDTWTPGNRFGFIARGRRDAAGKITRSELSGLEIRIPQQAAPAPDGSAAPRY